MDHSALKSWLDVYSHAWKTRDPKVAEALFADDATYQETPFDEPIRGRSAILEYWSAATRSHDQVRFGYKILAVIENLGIAQWWASFVRVPSKTQVKLNGVFVVSFDRANRCRVFREWWNRIESRLE